MVPPRGESPAGQAGSGASLRSCLIRGGRPRPGGALAAVSACPEADVIFVAHAGLDNIITVSDV